MLKGLQNGRASNRQLIYDPRTPGPKLYTARHWRRLGTDPGEAFPTLYLQYTRGRGVSISRVGRGLYVKLRAALMWLRT
jgi:hypothetical protein